MSIDLSLARLSDLLPRLPVQYSRPTVHIAGTNGKGSVSAIVSSIFSKSGLKTGRFNSPHLVHITDSILINEQPVSNDEYLAVQESILQTEGGPSLTPFELLALTALQVFERAQVDIAVVEVGMGGLTDATNVIPSECILASALTAVDLDHQKFLGNTISEIATHKAGIARQGKPFVLGPQKEENRKEVEEAVASVVGRVGAILAQPVAAMEGESHSSSFCDPRPVQFRIPILSSGPIHSTLPLHGVHQLENLSTALGIIQAILEAPNLLETSLTVESITAGISGVQWPGRLSWHTYKSRHILVDGAHNPASSKTLHDYIHNIVTGQSNTTHITFVLALSHSPPKTPHDTLAPLLKDFSSPVSVALVPFTPPSNMPWVKAVPPFECAKVVADLVACGPSSYSVWIPESVSALEEGASNTYLQDALEWAMSRGEGSEHLIVVAGSLYLVADFYRLLEQKP